jgi:SPP1 family phage portal protein
MVTLNLRDDCVGRVATDFRRGMTDKRFLELEITNWLQSPERKRQLQAEAYYDGDHAVTHRKRIALDDDGKAKELQHLPNNRLVNNQYSKMVDQKTNYSFGKPFSFDTENKRYAEALNSVLGSRFRRVLHNVGEGAWIEGKSWLYPYYEGNELAFKRFPADEVLPFWADADHTILDCAVHVYMIMEYDEDEVAKDVVKVEVMHGGGVDCFVRLDDGTLTPDPEVYSGPFILERDPQTGEEQGYNWERIPLICFKSSHHEIPLLSRVKCLQDAYNDVLSNFANQMEEDIHTTLLVIRNYDGEDLGRLRKNIAEYGVIKVRSYEGSEGGVETLTLEVNSENYKTLLSLLKDAIIENARGYDAKDERMGGNPNQMNIQSMYSDIDLDANGIEMEFQASMEELLWFVNQHLANTGKGSFDGTEVKVIFDRDVLINETEAINNCKNSVGILSNETIVKMHPWVSDPEQELKRIKDEQEEAQAADPYRAAFENNRQTGGSGHQDPPVKDGEGDGQTE